MSLSKNNLNKLEVFLKNSENIKNDKSNINLVPKTKHFSKNNSSKSSNPNDIFYSIIDNSDSLEDTILTNKNLKDSEEKFIKDLKSQQKRSQNSSQINRQLTEEDLLYDEFNYLLDE